MVKRGEVYFDPCYTYKTGNIADKLLVVLNKLHLHDQPIIIVPVKTDKANKYKKGCNHKSNLFRIEKNEDYFLENTLVPLDLEYYTMDVPIFAAKQQKGEMQFKANLKTETIASIIKCLEQIKQDISIELQKYIF